jgi:hypothetical protein
MSLATFLLALQNTLLNTAVGVVLFYLEEYMPWFAALEAKPKRLLTGAFSLVIPMAACALAVALGYQPGVLDTWWTAFVSGFVAFGVATMVHTTKLSSGEPTA